MEISNATTLEVSSGNGNSISKSTSDWQKQQWEQEFWYQQRQFKSDKYSAEDNASVDRYMARDKSLIRFSVREGKHSEITEYESKASLSNVIENIHVLSTSEAIDNRSPQKATVYMASPVNHQLDISHIKATKAISYSADSRESKALATSMVHLDGENAAVWLGDASLKKKPSFLKKIHEAFSFFGLKLKRLTIHGTQLKSVEMPNSISPEKEKDYGH